MTILHQDLLSLISEVYRRIQSNNQGYGEGRFFRDRLDHIKELLSSHQNDTYLPEYISLHPEIQSTYETLHYTLQDALGILANGPGRYKDLAQLDRRFTNFEDQYTANKTTAIGDALTPPVTPPVAPGPITPLVVPDPLDVMRTLEAERPLPIWTDVGKPETTIKSPALGNSSGLLGQRVTGSTTVQQDDVYLFTIDRTLDGTRHTPIKQIKTTIDTSTTETKGWVSNKISTTTTRTIETTDDKGGISTTEPVKLKTVEHDEINLGIQRGATALVSSALNVGIRCVGKGELPTVQDAGNVALSTGKNYITGMTIETVKACAGLSKTTAVKAGIVGATTLIVARLLEIKNSGRKLTNRELASELLPDLILYGIQVVGVFKNSSWASGALGYASIVIDGVIAADLYFRGEIDGQGFTIDVATKVVSLVACTQIASLAAGVSTALGLGVAGSVILPAVAISGAVMGAGYVWNKIKEEFRAENVGLQQQVRTQNDELQRLRALLAANNIRAN
jgi:hypothetical protein